MVGDAGGTARAVLAARLNALREGSGRTYASLARRIGVSGSSLHRYCTGRTVPAEFAPVERLARLCGASAADRQTLHRLWLLADGERADRQGAGEAAGGTADGPPGAGGGPEPAAVPAAQEAGEDTSAPVRDGGRPGAAADGVAAAAAPGPPGEGLGPSGGGTARPGPSSGEAETAVPEGGGLSPAPGSRPRRVRRYGQVLGGLAAASLVLALVAALGGTAPSGPDGGRSPARRPGPPPVGAPAPSPSGSSAPATPRAAPSASPSGTPSGGGTASPVLPGTGAREEGGSGPAEGPASGPAPGRTPFTWTGDDHVWKNGCDHAYRVDRAPAAVPPPPAEADAAPWAAALGAVHAGETGVRITVQGRDERAVVLESLRIRVVERRPVAGGRVYRMSSGCGGSLTPRMFDVDLDAPRPAARPVAGNDSGEPVAAVAFPYRVSVTEPEVFLITGRTVGCDCDWFAELGWSSGGRSGTVRVDDGGRPFRTGGVRGRPVFDYDTTARRWVTAEAGS
ncbi:helix-turn-helix domain-containing protein [Streptomyces sp. NPDC059698]|uniref:helix-turn-helix domain-containing protein n=3 Tax=Streptomyces TaxID=1883 RepID=UPI00093E31E2|nr:helix-turn-helix transcriptional regulator [Streptomyces sp. CB02366]